MVPIRRGRLGVQADTVGAEEKLLLGLPSTSKDISELTFPGRLIFRH